MAYEPGAIEKKWQKRWEDEQLFAVQDTSDKENLYILDMFPYPSGDGLHVGHVKIYTASDIVSRYWRMRGKNVLHPTGWDAFGLPTENTAIKKKIHPATLTKQNIDHFREQMKSLGWSYDWNREVNTTDPNYYKWTQWIFLQLYKAGLAYEATVPINWCPTDKTGLANEEVVDGKCERCGTPVETKPLRQWLLRITKYADQLLAGLDDLEWPKFIKDLQTNWIGRSEGARILFDVVHVPDVPHLEVFTTRPDTLFGATYVVVSPNHPSLPQLTSEEQRQEVEAYAQEAQVPTGHTNDAEKEKTGVFTGSYAVNPITSEKIPIWVADYVLMNYGSGAIMAVPAHDQRDFEFAKKYDLPIRIVICPHYPDTTCPILDEAYTGEGHLVESGEFNGTPSSEAGAKIVKKLSAEKKAEASVQYKLRDWVFARQRYWGEPIPLIHCDTCGIVPVPESDLPVELPEVEHYEPTGTGESPLAAIEEWVNVPCPSCNEPAKRETNTMPQWAGSSWYWLRYTSPEYDTAIADPAALDAWMPVDIYVGGAEHAVLHLLYARFWQQALKDQGIVKDSEPFLSFRSVGLVLGEDGEKMSKSRGNVINPTDVIAEHGADTLRIYEMFMGPFDHAVAWNTDSIRGARKFLDRVWNFVTKSIENPAETDSEEVLLKLHSTIQRVTEDTKQFKFNTSIAAMMELLNMLERAQGATISTLNAFVLVLAPYAPHMCEELWELLGHDQSLAYESLPQADTNILTSARVTIPVQVNGKLRGEIVVAPDTDEATVITEAKAVSNVARYLTDVQIRKTVYIPNKLLNFVVG